MDHDYLDNAYLYLDDVTVGGDFFEESREKSKKLKEPIKRRNITFNRKKTMRDVSRLKV